MGECPLSRFWRVFGGECSLRGVVFFWVFVFLLFFWGFNIFFKFTF